MLTKKSLYIQFFLVIIVSIFFLQGTSYGQQDRRGRWGDTPLDILKQSAGAANENLQIQDTELNRVTDLQGSQGVPRAYKITNTLDSVRLNIAPYLQWAVFIGLSIATILLIYNGFLLISSSIHSQGGLTTVLKRMGNIGIGIAVLLGFYGILRVIIILLNSFSQN